MERSPKSTYFIDSESGVEVVRLIEQDKIFTDSMGYLIPPELPVEQIKDILDIGCGPGGWALQVGTVYPEKQIVGIDLSKGSIDYAEMCAQMQYLQNTRFLIMDATEKLKFPDASFDLVNGRLLNTFLLKEQWPVLLAELRRIIKVGGFLSLVEFSEVSTNSSAMQEISQLHFMALQRNGRPYISNHAGKFADIGESLPALLEKEKWSLLGERTHTIDWSWGAPAHERIYFDSLALTHLLRPLVVERMQLVSRQRYDALCQRIAVELNQPDFRGTWVYQSVWGKIIL